MDNPTNARSVERVLPTNTIWRGTLKFIHGHTTDRMSAPFAESVSLTSRHCTAILYSIKIQRLTNVACVESNSTAKSIWSPILHSMQMRKLSNVSSVENVSLQKSPWSIIAKSFIMQVVKWRKFTMCVLCVVRAYLANPSCTSTTKFMRSWNLWYMLEKIQEKMQMMKNLSWKMHIISRHH